MRIHVGKDVTSENVWQAINSAGAYGEITRHGSRSHDHAYEVYLTGNSRRRPGFRRGSTDDYAATWDQWGVFLGFLFDLDENVKCYAYRDRTDFHIKTGHRFDPYSLFNRNINSGPFWPADEHGDHTFRYAGIPYEQSCTKCSAVKVWGPNV